jgi:hypothetical protein
MPYVYVVLYVAAHTSKLHCADVDSIRMSEFASAPVAAASPFTEEEVCELGSWLKTRHPRQPPRASDESALQSNFFIRISVNWAHF